jgi:hypothetical protein
MTRKSGANAGRDGINAYPSTSRCSHTSFFYIGAPTRLGISSLAQRGVQILQFDDGGVICEDMWS